MNSFYWLQFGVPGYVGLFESKLGIAFRNGDRVICRSSRGVESAQILNTLNRPDDGYSENETTDNEPIAGEILRPFLDTDALLAERLERYRNRAFESCQRLLAERNLEVLLVDVEQLHDGEHLYFHFLGEVTEQLNQITDELAEIYGQRVRFREFAERLASGCGPGCGTTASRCGTSGGCSSCSASSKCASKSTSIPS